jgi:tol-pal system beta propeller repeat protein TolB
MMKSKRLLPLGLSLLVTLVVGLASACQQQPVPAATPTAAATVVPSDPPAYPGPGSVPDAESAYPGGQQQPAAPFPEYVPPFEGKIAFHSERTGRLQIYVLDGATSETRQITDDPREAFEPSWSPDCQQLMFTTGAGSITDFDLYTIDRDGRNQQPFSTRPSIGDWAAAWSPNGDRVAFQTSIDGGFNVCIAGLDGEVQACLERAGFSNAAPSWSSDGTTIAFVSDRTGNWEIFVAAVDGSSAPVQLTNNGYSNLHPQISPDGRNIVYSSNELGVRKLYMMNIDGSDQRPFTIGSDTDITPRWVGNELIVFSSDRTTEWDLYMASRDGSIIQRLTYSATLDQWPVWCSN